MSSDISWRAWTGYGNGNVGGLKPTINGPWGMDSCTPCIGLPALELWLALCNETLQCFSEVV